MSLLWSWSFVGQVLQTCRAYGTASKETAIVQFVVHPCPSLPKKSTSAVIAGFASEGNSVYAMSGWTDGMSGFILEKENAPQQLQVLHDAKS